jgi:hypothetical protein
LINGVFHMQTKPKPPQPLPRPIRTLSRGFGMDGVVGPCSGSKRYVEA